LLPKSLPLSSVALKPKVGTQMVPSFATVELDAVPLLDTGIFVMFAASTAQIAMEC
jgi:hypothetical protein